jgi:hypothetical protein
MGKIISPQQKVNDGKKIMRTNDGDLTLKLLYENSAIKKN